MEIKRIIELLKFERECVKRNAKKECDRSCETCDIVQDERDLYRMYTEAIKFIKANTPHLLTLEESLDAPYVWMEANPSGLGVRKIRKSADDESIIYIESFMARPSMADADMFGKMYRCWSAKPSDEQRKETPWVP